MIYFDDKITPRLARRLRKLDEAFETYACDELIGEELDPSPLLLPCSAQPTVASVQDIGELAVTEVVAIGGGYFEVACEVYMDVELDLNDHEDQTECVAATFDITVTYDAPSRRVTEHRVLEAYHPDS